MHAATSQIIINAGTFVRCWCWVEVCIEGNGLSSSCRREAVNNTSRTATNVRRLLGVESTFISVYKELSRKYRTDGLVSVHDCCVRRVPSNGYISFLREPTKSYESYGKEK